MFEIWHCAGGYGADAEGWRISHPDGPVGIEASCGLARQLLFVSEESAQVVCDALNSVLSSITVE